MTRTSASPANRWLPTIRPWSRAAVRLFCFPYAGGGASMYREWVGALGDSIEVCPVQLPGREARFCEPAFTRLAPLVDSLADALGPHLDRPFALFGHSLGALVAFEVARRLQQEDRPGPSHLIVSGCHAPQVHRVERWTHTLPDADFREDLRWLGGTPAELLENDELMDLLLPTLRADFALCETYDYTHGTPVSCPITALGGRDDDSVGRDGLDAWRVQTTGRFALHVLPGNHFFVHSARTQLLAEVRHALFQRAVFERDDLERVPWAAAQAECVPGL